MSKKRIIKRKNEATTKCPECGEKLVYLESWEREFDRLDKNLPSFYEVLLRLEKEEIPKYECINCNTYIVVTV